MRYKLETIPRQKWSVRVLNKLAYRLESVAHKLRKMALDRFNDFEFHESELGTGVRDIGRFQEWKSHNGKLPTVEELDAR